MKERSKEQLEALLFWMQDPQWDEFCEILDSSIEGNTIENMSSVEDLWLAKGNLEIVNYAKLLKTWLEDAIDDL